MNRTAKLLSKLQVDLNEFRAVRGFDYELGRAYEPLSFAAFESAPELLAKHPALSEAQLRQAGEGHLQRLRMQRMAAEESARAKRAAEEAKDVQKDWAHEAFQRVALQQSSLEEGLSTRFLQTARLKFAIAAAHNFRNLLDRAQLQGLFAQTAALHGTPLPQSSFEHETGVAQPQIAAVRASQPGAAIQTAAAPNPALSLLFAGKTGKGFG